MSERIPLYLDRDTGVDDALALVFLLASSTVEVVSIGTVSGNTSAPGARDRASSLGIAGTSHPSSCRPRA